MNFLSPSYNKLNRFTATPSPNSKGKVFVALQQHKLYITVKYINKRRLFKHENVMKV
jgi:hypothetical protein